MIRVFGLLFILFTAAGTDLVGAPIVSPADLTHATVIAPSTLTGTQKVNAIAISANDADALVPVLKKAMERGMITLRRSGLIKVMDGATTLEEVARETVH